MLTDERIEQIKNIIHTELNNSLELKRTEDLPVDGVEFVFLDQINREKTLEDFRNILSNKYENIDMEYIEIDNGVFRCAVYDTTDTLKEGYDLDEE